MNQFIEFFISILFGRDFGAEPDSRFALLNALFDNFFNADERAAANEENIFSINFDSGGFRVLTLPALGEFDNATFQHFQQPLLNAFVSRVGSYRIIRAGFASDFIELVKVNNAVFSLFNIHAGGVVEIANGDFDICADETGFSEARGVSHGEGNIEKFGEVAKQSGFAATGRTNDDDVRLVDFVRDAVIIKVVLHALVMVIGGDGKDFLSAFLHDDELVEIIFNEVRFILIEEVAERVIERAFSPAGFIAFFVFDEVINILDTTFANAETGIGVEDGHISTGLNSDTATANATMITIKCHV